MSLRVLVFLPQSIHEHPESTALYFLKALCDLAKESTVVNPFKETDLELTHTVHWRSFDRHMPQESSKAIFVEYARDKIKKAPKPEG